MRRRGEMHRYVANVEGDVTVVGFSTPAESGGSNPDPSPVSCPIGHWVACVPSTC